MTDTLLTRLQNWYKTNCNGDWEHSWGLSIGTIDNPGWTVKINLAETPLENIKFERKTDNGTLDWIFIRVQDKVFDAGGDTTKLTEILKIFLDEVIPQYSDENYHYLIYIPLLGGPTKIWRPIYAKMLTEEILEIVDIPELDYTEIKTQSLDDITFKKEDIFSYKINYSIGDKIKTDLAEMFDGVTLIAKEE